MLSSRIVYIWAHDTHGSPASPPYYSASIITMAGITDKSLAIWLSAATSSMNFIGTFLGLWLVERLGRRSLTLGSLLGTTVSLFMMAITFQMAYINSPKVTFSNSVSSDCSADTCGVCTSKSSCGYCFMGDRNDIMNSTCVAVNKTSFDETESSKAHHQTESSKAHHQTESSKAHHQTESSKAHINRVL
ncbi:Proton myo-inositol cotransporter [Chionoecetes opilio]|uniref:Proton myo-inositol cotransporter n=1 Tax=Chionoecetes opilio TaxID=41210 RepID=A0A8J4YJ77_CHIOP|nr:Proton myo-inositol cotransporter [Chionoecetes opilio]